MFTQAVVKLVPLSVLATLNVDRRLSLRIPLPARRVIWLAILRVGRCAGVSTSVALSRLSSDVVALTSVETFVGIVCCFEFYIVPIDVRVTCRIIFVCYIIVVIVVIGDIAVSRA